MKQKTRIEISIKRIAMFFSSLMPDPFFCTISYTNQST